MSLKERYELAKEKLLHDLTICSENRKIFEQFLQRHEYKLKRINRLPALDEATFKTLCYYVSRLRTVNRWFDNAPWIHLTKNDIKRVYDDVEDGKIRRLNGAPFRGRDTYYNLILCGKPFETPWSKSEQLKTAQVEAMQRRLTALGLYKDKIDGKAGMLTRAALGAYQKKNGLKVDCWPTAAVPTIWPSGWPGCTSAWRTDRFCFIAVAGLSHG